MEAIYDSIGINYADLRVPDPRIAAVIHRALGPAKTVLNIGAGTGSYEPSDRELTAVEPSEQMIRQRKVSATRVIRASAENLPFDDNSFDAAMAILTVHHWQDRSAGLREMRRVTRGPIVLLSYDPSHRPWLTEYLPELAALDDERMPKMTDYAHWLGSVRICPVSIPHDCSDGFLYAYWRRPTAYLDARIRTGSSSFWAIGEMATKLGLQKLAADIETGVWAKRYADLLTRDTLDLGYRLVVAG
jgi:SAM-dependent methyltransferase